VDFWADNTHVGNSTDNTITLNQWQHVVMAFNATHINFYIDGLLVGNNSHSVTLPNNKVSYIHFPVRLSGGYVIFFDTTDVFDKVLDKNEQEIAESGGVPNGPCSDLLEDHYHIELTYNGSGGYPIPYVIRFKTVAAKKVKFIIKIHDGEEKEHDHDEEDQ